MVSSSPRLREPAESSGLSRKAESKDTRSFFSGVVVTDESTDSVSSIFQRIKGESLNYLQECEMNKNNKNLPAGSFAGSDAAVVAAACGIAAALCLVCSSW